jgi:hypothetical protein
MEHPKSSGDLETSDGLGIVQAESPTSDNLEETELSSHPPTIIDLVRNSEGELGVVKIQNKEGRIASSVTHDGQTYRVPELFRTSLGQIPVPQLGRQPYGSTRELLQTLGEFFQKHGPCSEPNSRLLACWVLSSWFTDCLPLSPLLIVTGPVLEAELLLLLLSCVCRLPFLLAGLGPAAFASLPMEITPTLLIREPQLNKRMADLLRASAQRNCLTVVPRGVRNLYCAKAVYVRAYGDVAMLGPYIVRIELASKPDRVLRGERLPSREKVQELQNKLFTYRMFNNGGVARSDFDTAFSSDTRAVARALGACIVGDRALQAELVPLLTSQDERLSKHTKSLEATVLEALLLHCHQQQSKSLVREITKTVNQIYEGRGERLKATVEEVGYKLKSLGLLTRRLGSSGRGLKFNEETQLLVHERAYAHHVISPDDQDEGCMHCKQLQLVGPEEIVKGV